MTQSPCSVPDWLRAVIPLETLPQQVACQRHDERYEMGGSRRLRLAVDLLFTQELLAADMDPDRAEQYLWAVRQYGAPHWTGDDHAGALPLHPPSETEAP
jgi:hypothetical protein